MLMRYGYGKLIKSITIGYPIDMCPLQAADIVAYEIRCEERQEMRPRRYPLERLHQLGCISGSQARLNEAIMKMTFLEERLGLGDGAENKTFFNAASKSAGSSEASTSRAISTKRLCRSTSDSFGKRFALDFCAMPHNVARRSWYAANHAFVLRFGCLARFCCDLGLDCMAAHVLVQGTLFHAPERVTDLGHRDPGGQQLSKLI
jgi:hypothetical protein